MNFFSSAKTPTKMFVSELYNPKKSQATTQKKSPKGVTSIIAQKMIEVAPELIDEGLKALSSTIAGLTEDYTHETLIHKNIDGDSSVLIFLPDHICIVRANFSHDVDEDDSEYKDGFGDRENLSKKPSGRKLQIGLDIVKSYDKRSFYFQPTNYYYKGRDTKNISIEEISISFAFVTAKEGLTDYNQVNFQPIILFKDLDNDHDYNFKRKDGSYDTTYQSPWIDEELSKRGPYTIILKIEERTYRKGFMKKINKIYKKHEEDLINKINSEIKTQLSSLKPKEDDGKSKT